MKKKLFYSIVILLSITVYSCSNNELDQDKPNLDDIEVVKMGDYIANTRGNIPEDDYNLSVLKFRNENVYNQTLLRIKEMNIKQREDFFVGLGFNGAYTMLKEADNELDAIFDIENDDQFLSVYSQFKSKFSDVFTFNDIDSYDLSPYLTFADDNLELLGNINGYIIIGDQIIIPNKKSPTFTTFENEGEYKIIGDGIYINTRSFPSEIIGDFRGFDGVKVMIKQGKYQSTMAIGYENSINSCPITVRYASQKKKKLWKRRHKSTYSAKIGVPTGKYPAHVSIPYSKTHSIAR